VHGGVVSTKALSNRHQRQARLIELAGVGKFLVSKGSSAHRHTGFMKQCQDGTFAEAEEGRQLGGGNACLVLGYQFGNDYGL
jgi:hypothetical protein